MSQLTMIEHDFPQGSPAWHRHRLTAFNASEAAAAMGISPYMTRDQLLYSLHTKTKPEVSPQQQILFDEGHRVEALGRPVLEAWTGKVLFPVVGSLPPGAFGLTRALGASFDGLNGTQVRSAEVKLLNADLRAALPNKGWEGRDLNDAANLPKFYRVQMQQQCMVCSTIERVLFAAMEFEGEKLVDCRLCWFTPDAALGTEIVGAWKQVEADLVGYVVPTEIPKPPAGEKITSLPALVVEVVGDVVASNLAEWKDAAIAKINTIRTELVSDQDFADGSEAVKWCESSKVRLLEVKAACLTKMVTVNELFETIDSIVGTLDTKRINLGNLIEARRKARQKEIVDKGAVTLNRHIEALEERLVALLPEGTRITGHLMPLIESDFFGAVKGKRSFSSMESAVNDEVARSKVLANQECELRERNLRTLQAKAKDHRHLFSDWKELIAKDSELVELQIDSRIKTDQERIAEEARKKREAEEAAAAAQRQREADALARAQAQASPPAVATHPLTTAQAPSPTGGGQLFTMGAMPEYRGPAAHAPAANQPAPSTAIPQEQPAARSGPPTLKAGEISARLGFVVTAAFLERIGHPPAEQVGTRILYHEVDFPAICVAIQRHIESVREQHLVREAA